MNDETIHQEGPPWKRIAKYDTFKQADAKRAELSQEEDLQVKIHRCGPRGIYFAVKTRIDPSLVVEHLKKEEKARRKKRLSKKRRKK